MGRASCAPLGPRGVRVWTPWLDHGPSARPVCEKRVTSNPGGPGLVQRAVEKPL